MYIYTISDIVRGEHIEIPKVLFETKKYRPLSIEAKNVYSLLLGRFNLSKMNGWINEKGEVYLNYSREEVAYYLCISYKKAIAAFKELVNIGLIKEERCGRGKPNRIYIARPDVSVEEAKEQVQRDNLRTAESACLTLALEDLENEENSMADNGVSEQGAEEPEFKTCQNGTLRSAETALLDLSNRHPKKKEGKKKDKNNIYISQSVFPNPKSFAYTSYFDKRLRDRQADDMYSLEDILENCQLDTFEEEERKILYDALERLYYSDNLRIGNAVLPRDKVRSRMYEIDASTLQSAMHKLHQNDREVKNMTAYVMSIVFNCITEDYTLLHIDPYLNSIRKVKKE